jgi:hypothetical protein
MNWRVIHFVQNDSGMTSIMPKKVVTQDVLKGGCELPMKWGIMRGNDFMEEQNELHT